MSAVASLSLQFTMRRSSEQKCNLLQECLKSCTNQTQAELLLYFCPIDICTSQEAPELNKNTVKFGVILHQNLWINAFYFRGGRDSKCLNKKGFHLFLRTEPMLRKRRVSLREGGE